MKVTPISAPLPGEHLAATWPTMRLDLEDSRPRTSPLWRQRMRFWSGRALTAEALDRDQENRAAHLAWRGRMTTAGIVTGLEVALEAPAAPPDPLTRAGHFVHVLPGHGITGLGDDVTVPRPLRVALDRIPARGLGADAMPWAAVLVLRPAEFGRFDNIDPADPCELDPSRDAFADERRQDAVLLELLPLPDAFQARPELGNADDERWRNRLAYLLFNDEVAGAVRQQIRFRDTLPAGQRWDTFRPEAALPPWELEGVPLALLASELVPGAAQRALFLDRAAVARPGGRSRARRRPAIRLATVASAAALNPPGAGDAAVWRARFDQFAEHFVSLDPAAAIATRAQRFQFLPPAGLLPRAALDILTTADAIALSATDRAAVSRFFPATLAVEAVPAPLEDLDAALAASAPLAPFDLASAAPDLARIIVPVPQRVFDPRLLVIEQEDPIFATTVARFVAERQDWRQRRDGVNARYEALQALVSGPPAAAPREVFDAGQLEPEPTETLASLGFTAALLSPATTRPPWELGVTLAGSRVVNSDTLLYILLRTDNDGVVPPIDARWHSGAQEFSFRWNVPSDYPPEQIGADGQPLATPLWRRFTVRAGEIGLGPADITGVSLRLASGRIAVAGVGELTRGRQPGEFIEQPWWGTQDTDGQVQSIGGEWTRLTGPQLLAPFEAAYEPVFEDGQSLDQRLDDLDTRLQLPAERRVRVTGLTRLIEDVEREIKRGDDSVDLGFLRTQANIHRVRQVILGDEAANELLTSPALNSFVQTKSARLSNEQLLDAYKKQPDAPRLDATIASGTGPSDNITRTTAATAGVPTAGLAFGGTPLRIAPIETIKLADPAILGGLFDLGLKSAVPARDDVIASEPSIGKTFELRTLSFAKRFDEGATRTAFNYADAELQQTVAEVTRHNLGMNDDNEVIPDVTDSANRPVTFAAVARGGADFLAQLRFPSVSPNDDSSAILARGVRHADISVLILRRFEFHLARRREALRRAREVLAAIRVQIAAIANRLGVLAGRLAEARHDVSVARALRAEEQARIAAINERRDAILRDEVRFLAFVRPRTLDLARRAAPAWRLESADAPGDVPACLAQHDEPPNELRAFLQLFRHAPARWFTAIAPRLSELNTREKLVELIAATRQSAVQFTAAKQLAFVPATAAAAPLATIQSAFSIVESVRREAARIQVALPAVLSWADHQRTALQHAALGDVMNGRHGNAALARAAATEVEQMEKIATCLHAEFAAVSPALRLGWVERYSQFDRPSPLHDLTVLPGYASLSRPARRRFQSLVDWLFGRIDRTQRDAVSLMNDLVRICLLLASHAPVKQIIVGRLPRPTPVRPGIRIPIKPLDPKLVRVGMEFHVWQASTVIARGLVEDLQDGEVSARVDHVATATAIATLDETMRVQFVPAAPGFALNAR
jgi:hypothetical protein